MLIEVESYLMTRSSNSRSLYPRAQSVASHAIPSDKDAEGIETFRVNAWHGTQTLRSAKRLRGRREGFESSALRFERALSPILPQMAWFPGKMQALVGLIAAAGAFACGGSTPAAPAPTTG